MNSIGWHSLYKLRSSAANITWNIINMQNIVWLYDRCSQGYCVYTMMSVDLCNSTRSCHLHNSINQCLSWKPNTFSDNQENFRILNNPNVYFHVQRSSPLVFISGHINALANFMFLVPCIAIQSCNVNQHNALFKLINPLKPNDLKKRRTAQLTSRCCILYIYSTNIRTKYFKHAA